MKHQHFNGPIVLSVEEVPELCGPDWCKLRLRNGIVLTIGDEGVTAYFDGPDWQGAEPVMGIIFPAPISAQPEERA